MRRYVHVLSGLGLLLLVGWAVPLAGAADLQSDEFDGPALANFWQIRNPNNAQWALEDGKLKIVAEHNSNVWADDTSTRFYQVTSEDFDVETSMLVHYLDASTVAGIIVYSPTTQDIQGRDGEWVTLKLWGRGADQGNNAVLQYQRRENDDPAFGYVPTQPDYNPPQGDIPVALRVQRNGDEYRAWFKPDATGDWIEVGTVINPLQPPLEVGIYAGIAQADGGELTVWFDYFREASNPVTAVDPRHKVAVTWGTLKAE